MRIIISLLAALFIANNANAIDKKYHPEITQQALLHFKICAKELGLRDFSNNEGERIARYTGKEDDASLDRVTNWHFYDHYVGTEFAMPTYKSLHRIFNHRIDQLSSALEYSVDREILSNAGRIIHYLQDAGIPAHVAPNYHAKPNNWLESLFTKDKADPVDSLMDPKLNSYRISAEACRHLYNENMPLPEKTPSSKTSLKTLLNKLLVDLAEKTRNNIDKTIFTGTNTSFEKEFWNLRRVKDGHKPGIDVLADFAAYGHDDRDRFSANHSPCLVNQDNKKKCDDFIAVQYHQIMNTTIRALMYISELKQQTH